MATLGPAVVLAVWLLAIAGAQAQAAPERFVQQAGREAMAIAGAGGPAHRVAAQFQSSMRRYVDTDRMAIFALGRYRQALPTSRRAEYRRLVERFVARIFATYHGDFVGGRLEVVSSRPTGEGLTLVRTRVLRPGMGAPSEIEWRVAGRGGRLQVVDMKVRGIWLILQMRSQFASVLERSGGDINALFAYLQG